jgi:hypothetical protein
MVVAVVCMAIGHPGFALKAEPNAELRGKTSYSEESNK